MNAVVRYVHHCPGCGRYDVEPSPALLDRRCAGCGTLLESVEADRWAARRAELRRSRPAPAPLRTPWPVLLLIGVAPFALSLLGHGGSLVFLAPMALCLVTAYHCIRAGRTWWLFAAASLIAAVSSLIVVGGALAGVGDTAGLYLGGAASVALVLAGWDRLRLVAPAAQPGRLVDGALWAAVAVAPVAWFVAGDALHRGDPALAAVVGLDLAGAFAAIVALRATADRPDRRIARGVVAGFALVVAGDTYAYLASAGQVGGATGSSPCSGRRPCCSGPRPAGRPVDRGPRASRHPSRPPATGCARRRSRSPRSSCSPSRRWSSGRRPEALRPR